VCVQAGLQSTLVLRLHSATARHEHGVKRNANENREKEKKKEKAVRRRSISVRASWLAKHTCASAA